MKLCLVDRREELGRERVEAADPPSDPDRLGIEALPQVGVVVAEPLGDLGEDLDRLCLAVCEEERPAELEPGECAPGPIGALAPGRLQVADRVRQAGPALGEPEREENLGSLRVGRRLGEGPAQVLDGRRICTACESAGRCRPERADDVVFSCRLRLQQVRRRLARVARRLRTRISAARR